MTSRADVRSGRKSTLSRPVATSQTHSQSVSKPKTRFRCVLLSTIFCVGTCVFAGLFGWAFHMWRVDSKDTTASSIASNIATGNLVLFTECVGKHYPSWNQTMTKCVLPSDRRQCPQSPDYLWLAAIPKNATINSSTDVKIIMYFHPFLQVTVTDPSKYAVILTAFEAFESKRASNSNGIFVATYDFPPSKPTAKKALFYWDYELGGDHDVLFATAILEDQCSY